MEQAYDSMGWRTLKQVECGFRQGCPLSSYLFIMCSELLTEAFKRNGSKIGVKVAPKADIVSHLQYADNIINFSDATRKNARKIKKILKNYSSWTGQKISNTKSSMIFGKAVQRGMSKVLSKFMGFKVVDEMNYLGIKMTFRRLKASDYQDVLEKAYDKLNGWGNLALTLAGKLQLIKTSLLSIPVFISTHSLVPMGVLRDLEKLCRNFLWTKQDKSSGIHYVEWKQLCRQIKFGGQGAVSAPDRVGSWRAKFAWNLFSIPDSLLNRILIAKYGKNFCFSEIKLGSSPTWKIINNGGKFLQQIVKWKVSDGESINTTKDIWILDKSINKWPTFVSNIHDEQSCLKHYIHNGSWNFNNLNQSFGKELVDQISSVPINVGIQGDDLENLFKYSGTITRNGKYAPIDIRSWDQMPKSLKKNMLEVVQEKFEITRGSDVWVLQSIGKKWRNSKADVKSRYYDPNMPTELQLCNVPKRILKDQWKNLISYRNSEESMIYYHNL
ncbi:uncharacterized protein LOC110107295 [Dendrobium catenatum]|uniref:uncharacterized protein LOC110107295 n=1 Tax=Dendrobium catenatum TaxID=906689 RepID=UPI0010A093EC|nr:uncharacterized protein LOC110107295 [Dendrobium catenatum]